MDLLTTSNTTDYCTFLNQLQHQLSSIASLVLNSPFIWQTKQSLSVTMHGKSLNFPGPTELCAGPSPLQRKPLSYSIWCHSTKSQSFVDNAQIQDSTLPQNMQCSISISSQETCVSDIQTWMLENKLKLRMTKQRLSSSFKSFPLIPVSKPTTTSGCGREFSLSS